MDSPESFSQEDLQYYMHHLPQYRVEVNAMAF